MSVQNQIHEKLTACLNARVEFSDLPPPVAERDDLARLKDRKGKAAAHATRDLIDLIVKHMGGDAVTILVESSHIILHAQKFAHWMLARCSEGRQTQDAVEEFDSFFRRGELTGQLISVLGFAEVGEPIEIGAETCIVPAPVLAKQTERLGGLWNPLRGFPIAGINAPCVIKKVSLPFRMKAPIDKRTPGQVKHAVAEHKDLEEEVFEPFQRECDQLDQIRLVLSLCGPTPLIEHGVWVEWDKDASPLWYFQEEVPRQTHQFRRAAVQNRPVLEKEPVQTLLEGYFQLSETERKALRIPLSRLNQSMRRVNVVDRAIDLGIALEALIISGKDDDGVQGELTYRLSHRGACFLKEDVPSRRKVFHLLKAAYHLRSRAIHSGNITGPAKSGGETWDPEKALSEAQAVCAQILTRCIMRGGRPEDWNVFAFGPEPEDTRQGQS